MGASFHTFAVPGARGAEVVDALQDWYERRGFSLVEQESLYDRPSADERWLIVAADDRWTIVVDTDADEHERVGWEVARIGAPLLELWVFDSDVWGYRLFIDGREGESFCSNPRYGGGDAPDDATVPIELCRVAGLTGREREIAALFRQKKLFAERALSRFAAAIGAPGAAADYPCWLDPDDTRTRGYTVGRLRFARPSESVVVDLHSDRFPRRAPPPKPRDDDGMPPLPTETMVAIAGMQTFGALLSLVFRLVLFLLTPLTFALRTFHRVKRGLGGPMKVRMIPGVAVDGRTVRVQNHGLQFELPVGAVIEPQLFVRGLFAFRVGGLGVFCTPRRPSDVAVDLTVRHDAVVLNDASYFAGDRPARGFSVRESFEDSKKKVTAVHRAVEVVQGPEAMYVFSASCAGPVAEADITALRDAVRCIVFRPVA